MKLAAFPCLAALLVTFLMLPPAADSQDKVDPFYSGAPFTLNYLLQSVGNIPDKRLTIAISHRGVDFKATPADLDKLKKAGAGPELLRMISASAPKVAPPPPTPPPTAP